MPPFSPAEFFRFLLSRRSAIAICSIVAGVQNLRFHLSAVE
jgi:hypothetical protein